jgi:hypothetical protein
MRTPTPWVIANNGKPLFGRWDIRQDPPDWDGHGYQHIASLPADPKGTHYGDMFHANAAFIVLAVNNHDSLIECLKRYGRHLEGCGYSFDPYSQTGELTGECTCGLDAALKNCGAL